MAETSQSWVNKLKQFEESKQSIENESEQQSNPSESFAQVQTENVDQIKHTIKKKFNHAVQRKLTHRMTISDSKTEVFCMNYDHEDDQLAAGFGDGMIRIYRTSDGRLISTLHCEGGAEEIPITGLKWRPVSQLFNTTNVLVSTHADGSMRHWHTTSGKLLHTYQGEPSSQLYCLDYNRFGTMLAVGGKDHTVKVFDETTKSLAVTMKEKKDLPGHSNRIFSVKFNPCDKNMIVSGGWDKTVQIYDIRNRGPVASIYGPYICGDGIDFRTDAVQIVTASYRQTDVLEVYDLRMFKKIRTFDWEGAPMAENMQDTILTHSTQAKTSAFNSFATKQKSFRMAHTEFDYAPNLYCARFNKTQDLVYAGGAGDNEFRAFDWYTGQIVCKISNLKSSILSMDLANCSNRFALGTADSTIRVYNLSAKDTKHPIDSEDMENVGLKKY